MKKLFSILAVFLITSMAFAQKNPKINFAASDNTIDYGKVEKSSDNGIRSFEFTNTGDAPLIITSVQSTTGIVIIATPSSGIQPGKSGKIDIKYNMTVGPIRKTITVETNATNYPEGRVALKIKGEVVN